MSGDIYVDARKRVAPVSPVEGFRDKRTRVEHVAFDSLAESSDPVAVAIREAVREATTVEVTPELIGSFRHMFGTWPTPDGMTEAEFALRVALQAAGFEVRE